MIFDRHRVIDVDTHITEPADVWTARVSKKWGDLVPHIKNVGGVDLWFVGDQTVGMPGAYSAAGHTGTFPDLRKRYEDIPRAMFDAKARLAQMDEEKLFANVIYPNVGGFGAGGFLRLENAELRLECVRAYNDFLLDWCSADRRRLIPVMATPFWDLAASVKEIERCAAKGYKAVIFCNQPQDHGAPLLRDRHWDPIWATAQDAGLSISFHIGGGSLADEFKDPANIGVKANFARVSTMATLENARCIADLILSGIPHRYPKLPLVSVESGVGWVPYLLESMDWQWRNNGVHEEHPEYDLLPSEYFRRQIYTSFWFEEAGLAKAIELYPDNVMFETDYPHPTCQAPGPASAGTHPRLYAERSLSGIPEALLAKVLHGTAAKIYGLA